ncbi:glycoside hydrolase family 108 protein [Phocoenobacter skyensis]|uniref:Glycoside hydrolase family 108 protein n=1 Tax=Phocoenobacter skyensis TaxID=97481 RepID=A0ABT9JNK7_9PAST|nr:glycoside hydrolase family 108 protein [Pasteurella skyensis]MDP8080229.1 glycoside hydrolase family 108 protein [Pasteurella skyensis]MDP8086232.1 glycoside hydrolase family 108 protein [Pasteurella skyensis]
MSKIIFKPIFDRLIAHEGGYTHDPYDKGGETNWGITKRVAILNGYNGSMREMTREQAFDIYYSAFWQRYKCDKIPPAIVFQFFDACVNHGFGNASRMLQRAVDVADDGVIGEITLGAIEQYNPLEVCVLFNKERTEFYTKLSTFNRFGKGWIRRVAQNLEYAVKDCGGQ